MPIDTGTEQMHGRPAEIYSNDPLHPYLKRVAASSRTAVERLDRGSQKSWGISGICKRWRQSLLPAEPAYAALEARLQKAPTIAVPTITIDGKYDPFTPDGDGSACRAQFTGRYQHRVLGVGHTVPQEAPHDFARAVIDATRL
jgi:pimeloyl-ACP methyl ester carboxylesterase